MRADILAEGARADGALPERPNPKFQYKVVRRNTAVVAVVGLSFLVIRQVAGGKTDAAKAFNDRGEAYAREGAYDRAIQDFDQAIELDPKNAEGFHARGRLYLCHGDYDQAVQDFDRAIKLNPGDADMIAGRARAEAHNKSAYDPSLPFRYKTVKARPLIEAIALDQLSGTSRNEALVKR